MGCLVVIYYRFTVEFAVETTFGICEHLTKLQAYDIKLQVLLNMFLNF